MEEYSDFDIWNCSGHLYAQSKGKIYIRTNILASIDVLGGGGSGGVLRGAYPTGQTNCTIFRAKSFCPTPH